MYIYIYIYSGKNKYKLPHQIIHNFLITTQIHLIIYLCNLDPIGIIIYIRFYSKKKS